MGDNFGVVFNTHGYDLIQSNEVAPEVADTLQFLKGAGFAKDLLARSFIYYPASVDRFFHNLDSRENTGCKNRDNIDILLIAGKKTHIEILNIIFSQLSGKAVNVSEQQVEAKTKLKAEPKNPRDPYKKLGITDQQINNMTNNNFKATQFLFGEHRVAILKNLKGLETRLGATSENRLPEMFLSMVNASNYDYEKFESEFNVVFKDLEPPQKKLKLSSSGSDPTADPVFLAWRSPASTAKGLELLRDAAVNSPELRAKKTS
jgi:hypothetical protein